jgi:uncharacterized protein (TIGR00369 family)
MPDSPSSPVDYPAVEAALREASTLTLPGHMGLELVEIAQGRCRMRCGIQPFHLAPNGYLHAGAVITLADTTAGFGCVGNFPEGASGFTTIEMKSNFLGTLLEGTMSGEATLVHGGRTTQVWDVEVRDESSGKLLALFRCTQLILYPRA